MILFSINKQLTTRTFRCIVKSFHQTLRKLSPWCYILQLSMGKYVMCHSRVAIVVTSLCLWMVYNMTLSALTLKTFRRTANMLVDSAEMEVSASSEIDCAMNCREYPLCNSFAYDDMNFKCLLRPNTSSTGDTLKELSVYLETGPRCSILDINESVHSVTIQRSQGSVTAYVTCNADYFPPVLLLTCSNDGRWSDLQCVKRIWRYTETNKTTTSLALKIPSTVTVNFSVCIEGNFLQNDGVFYMEILTTSGTEIPIRVAWRYVSSSLPLLLSLSSYLAINAFLNGAWGPETRFYINTLAWQQFYFRMVVSSLTTVDIFINGVYITRQTISRPLTSFSIINTYGNISLMQVEAWCSG